MRIIIDNVEKEPYRIIERSLFDKAAKSPGQVIKNNFNLIEHFTFDWLGHEKLFGILTSKFWSKGSDFCIATQNEKEPIFCFDLKNDTIKEYYSILNQPNLIGLNFPDPDAGLSITHERIYFYNPDRYWCLYADRYYDTLILATNDANDFK